MSDCSTIYAVDIPGPPGSPGSAGAPGSSGVSAFTTVSNNIPDAQPAMPAQVQHLGATLVIGSPVVVFVSTAALVAGMTLSGPGLPGGTTILSVDDATHITASASATANGATILGITQSAIVNTTSSTAFMVAGEYVFVQGWGTMLVASTPSALSVALTNPKDLLTSDYLTNVSPGTLLSPASGIVPTGRQGIPGSVAAGALLIVNNLNDVNDAGLSRGNLGIGTVGTFNQGNGNGAVAKVDNVAGLTNGQSLFATAAGIESKTPVLARAALGLIIGTNVQSQDATLQSLAALGTIADRIAYTTNVDVWAETPLTAYIRTVLAAANAAAARALLGVSGSSLDYLLYRQVMGAGVGGGANAAAAWNKVPINTELVDQGNHGTLAANQVTLAAGTYRYRFSAMSSNGAGGAIFQGRLYNVTNASVVADGYGNSGGDASVLDNILSVGTGRFTIAVANVFELQIFTAALAAFGKASNTGAPENYSQIEFWFES